MTVAISLMLAVPSARDAAGWYERALGARRLWDLGSVVGLAVGDAPFFLHEPTSTGFASPAAPGATTVRVELFCDDPDAFLARAVACGADGADGGVTDHEAPWGLHRQGRFTDPFGHVWHVGDASPLRALGRVAGNGA